MHWSAYLLSMLLAFIGLAGLVAGGSWTWTLVLIAFGLIPAGELVLKPMTKNRDEQSEAEARASLIYRIIPALFVPLQWTIVVVFLVSVSTGRLSGFWELLGATATVGVCCGAFGINVGHELGHRGSRWEQGLAKLALASTLYVHFFIEHNRGHHRRVATHEDPATARRGELVYGFWFRSVVGGWRSAWSIAPKEMLRLTVAQTAVWLVMCVAAGPLASGLMVIAAITGVLLLETVNYIEHYGLFRKKLDNGRYERVAPVHSWNSDHPLGRALLFDVSRHSDHHAHPGRPYAVLRSFEDTPHFPTGYPGMILLSLVPPLFFRVMNPLLHSWDQARA